MSFILKPPEKITYMDATHIPKCPVCGSPDIQKISTTSKVLDVAFWGFAAGKPKKHITATAVTMSFKGE